VVRRALFFSRFVIVILCVGLVTVAKNTQGRPAALSHWGLWYDEAAEGDENSALPIDNGRLGGMIFGQAVNDRIQLNEDTLWTGQPNDPSRSDAHTYLAKIRNEIFYGDRETAQSLYGSHMMGTHQGQAYQTVGSLYLNFTGPVAQMVIIRITAKHGIIFDTARNITWARKTCKNVSCDVSQVKGTFNLCLKFTGGQGNFSKRLVAI
jgi:hypothetical protein